MVLIWVVTSILSLNSPSLFDNYRQKIRKDVANTFAVSRESSEFRRIKDIKEIESYSISINDSIIGNLFLKEVRACNLNGCQVISKDEETKEDGEYFDLMVMTNQKREIKFMRVLDYFSEFGYEVCHKSYLKQFYGHFLCSKENQKVDAISGATVSSNAIINSLADFCNL